MRTPPEDARVKGDGSSTFSASDQFVGEALRVASRPHEGSRGLQPTVQPSRGPRRGATLESPLPSSCFLSRRSATKFHSDSIRGLKSTATFIFSLRENPVNPNGIPSLRPTTRRSPQHRWRSADFQSAVSRICNLRTPRTGARVETADALPSATRRYGRLKICATSARASLRPSASGLHSSFVIRHSSFLHSLFRPDPGDNSAN
jgi:hypothetical protein